MAELEKDANITYWKTDLCFYGLEQGNRKGLFFENLFFIFRIFAKDVGLNYTLSDKGFIWILFRDLVFHPR